MPLAAAGGAPVVAILDGRALDNGRLYVCIREASGGGDRGFASPLLTTLTVEVRDPVLGGELAVQPLKQLCVYLSTPSGDSLLLASGSATPGPALILGRVPLKVTVVKSSHEGITIQVDESPWRGSYALEGVECAPAAQVATAAWGVTADAYVIDTGGKVR